MNKSIYIIAFSLTFAASGMAQNTKDKDKNIDMGMRVTTEWRKTQSVSAIYSEELEKNATVSPYNALYGLLPGLSVMQNTGWDAEKSRLNVRGRGSLNGATPLFVVDGFARPLEYINLSEIESVTVLKDGAATALWGGRGANGVVLITTKRGKYSQKEIKVDYKFGLGLPVNQPEFADAYTYAKARNEALRNDGLAPDMDEEGFLNGGHPDLYPNVDWQKEALRNHTTNHQLDILFRGGGKRLRYFTALNYKNDMGLLNPKYTDYTDRYNSQMKKYFLNLRMNLDVDITDITRLKLNMLGMLRETKRPSTSEGTLFGLLYNTPAAAFPIHTGQGEWGGSHVLKTNPIAALADVGYYKLNQRMLQADLRLTQDLSVLTRGLSAELAVAYDNNATYREQAKKGFRYQTVDKGMDGAPVYTYYGNANDELKIDNGGLANQYIHANFEGKVNYRRAWEKHDLSASALFRHESMTLSGANNSRYRQYIIGTVGYSYDNRYMVDVVANCFGSSVLGKNDKYRFYPAVSAAWMLSNEGFMRDVAAVDYLKLRVSYGRSGFDLYDYAQDRQYWVGSGSYHFQDGNTTAGLSLKEGVLAMNKLDLEVADKYNIGVDVSLFKGLSLSVDGFYDRRSNILIDGSGLISSAIGVQVPNMNAGRVDTKGVDGSVMWKKQHKDFQYYTRVNFSYVRSNVKENGEGYQPYSYLSAKGYPLGQVFGWEAIGYFRDEEDIKNSPVQRFSEVRPGDVKYKDLNGDKVIDKNDMKAIGHSSMLPEIYYGISLGFEYKGFGIDALFQGIGRYSVMLNTPSVYWPLRNNTNISEWYLKDKIRWTEETKEIANVPRLTTEDNANNFRNSTQWLENGSYLKLRNLNVYYNLPAEWIKKVKMKKVQVYARANNLFSLDHVKYLNSESLKVNYPDMTAVYFGLNINF
ncbi:SusC/RagA family TonB-linked outer membrane protein [Bacteroides pyogenes]|uniref:SusC/RagA family TonB-linked outer membrane protein n=1 Tax=Bacteroides pyogenes TaxID=310300 RepID=UPI001F21F70A|nr:SusC/RagA family TonB-linked outer membrane protein [Bacteroides pyogenes]MCF2708546.1 SusC/RagA family TonB-linked outer membrane protein [Bacteroides pyogenes]